MRAAELMMEVPPVWRLLPRPRWLRTLEVLTLLAATSVALPQRGCLRTGRVTGQGG